MGPNLGDPNRDHTFDNPPNGLSRGLSTLCAPYTANLAAASGGVIGQKPRALNQATDCSTKTPVLDDNKNCTEHNLSTKKKIKRRSASHQDGSFQSFPYKMPSADFRNRLATLYVSLGSSRSPTKAHTPTFLKLERPLDRECKPSCCPALITWPLPSARSAAAQARTQV